MKGLDYHFDCMLADYLDAPDEPEAEPAPCVYCGHDCDEHDDCTNPDCPEQ
jgi:hypothetical protein